VIGDAARLDGENGEPLPGLAAVATQQGRHVGRIIRRNIPREIRPHFRYRDYGLMATIGRAKAVARIWKIELSGLPAWLLWSLVHIRYLIGFRNKLVVMVEWIWAYMRSSRAARLITNRSFGDGDW
jgi:NADH dehydrogenase